MKLSIAGFTKTASDTSVLAYMAKTADKDEPTLRGDLSTGAALGAVLGASSGLSIGRKKIFGKWGKRQLATLHPGRGVLNAAKGAIVGGLAGGLAHGARKASKSVKDTSAGRSISSAKDYVDKKRKQED